MAWRGPRRRTSTCARARRPRHAVLEKGSRLLAMPTLTDKGRQWAHAHFADSLVARVALNGGGWPDEVRATAIRVCNGEGGKEVRAA